MFKLVVLFAVAAVGSAKPGYLEPAVAYPIATSHSSRIDIHHKPIAYATPIVHAPIVKTVVAPVAPIVKTIVSPAVYPAGAVSHASRVDLHEAVGPVLYGGYGHGFGHELGHGYGGLDGYYGHGLYGHELYGHGGYGHYW